MTTQLDQMRDDYDWQCAFEYASGGKRSDDQDWGGSTHADHTDVAEPVPGATVSGGPFTLHDVAEILGASEGENDGLDWVCYGKLKDGRYFAVRAGCDYTGWG